MTVIVFFDVETTGFGRSAEIIQIAACSGGSSFNIYITPNKPVHEKATEINGLQLRNGYLYLNNCRTNSYPARYSFKKFLLYLMDFKTDVILVAHNCFTFDMPKIVDLAEKLGFLDPLRVVVKGFNDSLSILKNVLNERPRSKKMFTLEVLVQDYLPSASTDKLHNARHDTKLLQSLLKKLAINDEHFMQSPKGIDQYLHEKEIRLQKEKDKIDRIEKKMKEMKEINDEMNCFEMISAQFKKLKEPIKKEKLENRIMKRKLENRIKKQKCENGMSMPSQEPIV